MVVFDLASSRSEWKEAAQDAWGGSGLEVGPTLWLEPANAGRPAQLLLPATTRLRRLRSLLEMLDGNHLRPLCVARMREEHHQSVVGEHARIARNPPAGFG